MQRYLPGIRALHLPADYDWRHSCIVPRLADNISVIGMVRLANSLYSTNSRLGKCFNAGSRAQSGIYREFAPPFSGARPPAETIPAPGSIFSGSPPRERHDGVLRVGGESGCDPEPSPGSPALEQTRLHVCRAEIPLA